MKAVLTGDIIDSRKVENPERWIRAVEKVLSGYGKSPGDWEIFRGDSFQLATETGNAFKALFHLKAALRAADRIDARIAVGIGEAGDDKSAVTLRTGTAFEKSGEAFDRLKRERRTMLLSCTDENLDRDLNIVLQLAEALLDGWTQVSAEALLQWFEQPGIAQTSLAEKLGITQPSVSARLKTARADEIQAILTYYSDRIKRPLR